MSAIATTPCVICRTEGYFVPDSMRRTCNWDVLQYMRCDSCDGYGTVWRKKATGAPIIRPIPDGFDLRVMNCRCTLTPTPTRKL
jgi:hypothetical protein